MAWWRHYFSPGEFFSLVLSVKSDFYRSLLHISDLLNLHWNCIGIKVLKEQIKKKKRFTLYLDHYSFKVWLFRIFISYFLFHPRTWKSNQLTFLIIVFNSLKVCKSFPLHNKSTFLCTDEEDDVQRTSQQITTWGGSGLDIWSCQSQMHSLTSLFIN